MVVVRKSVLIKNTCEVDRSHNVSSVIGGLNNGKGSVEA